MTLVQVRIYSEAIRKIEADNLKAQAVAIRAGMADEKDWKRWLKSF